MSPFRIVPFLMLLCICPLLARSQAHWTFTRQQIQPPPGPVTIITEMKVASTGRMYAMIGHPPMIWMYDSSGAYVGSIGREGKGPGEFTVRLGAIGVVHDTVWGSDRGSHRINCYSLDGKSIGVIPLGDIRLPGSGNSPSTLYLQSLIRDGAIAWYDEPAQDRNPDAPRRHWLLRISRASVEGKETQILDTLGTRVFRHQTIFTATKDGIQVVGSQPWHDNDLAAISSNAAAIALAPYSRPTDAKRGTFSLIVRGDRGVVWKRDVPYTPQRITNAMVDSAFVATIGDADSATLTRLGGKSAFRRLFDAGLFRPKFLPPVADVQIGNDTTLWVRRTAAFTGPMATWEIFDKTGNQIATTELPAQLLVFTVSRSSVWATDFDQDGNQFIVRYYLTGTR